jgi:hypothetical protein
VPLYDGLHQTDGGWAAFAGYWFDALCPTPGLAVKGTIE